MAQHITTLLDKPDAENVSGTDYLYLVQGTGSDRDRKISLEALFASDPSHNLLVNENDVNPAQYLGDKFLGTPTSASSYGQDVAIEAVNTRGGYMLMATIVDGHVTTDKLADDSVTYDKMADDSVGSSTIRDEAVLGSKIPFTPYNGMTDPLTIAEGTTDSTIASVGSVYANGFYDFTVGFRNITVYPLLNARIELQDSSGNVLASFDFSDYTSDAEWHYGRFTGKASTAVELSLHLVSNAQTGVSSINVGVSYSGFTIA